MRFSFATAQSIEFGPGVAQDLPRLGAALLGPRILLVTGRDPTRSRDLAATLAAEGAELARVTVPGEPDLPAVLDAVTVARTAGATGVLAIGGGSAIDMGKAVAGLAPAPRPALDHLEVVGHGLPLTADPLPLVAMPTTAGTGAEVTRNAVIGVPEHRRKVSLRDPRLLPRLALVDPDLTAGTPWPVTLGSGLDAITQVIEPYLSPYASPLTDTLCRDAIPRGLAALRRLQLGEDRAARAEMAWVSLCGGMALANARLGAVHGLAGVIGGWTGAAHGALCGRLLPQVLRVNQVRARNGIAGPRIAEVAGWIAAAFGVRPDAAFATLGAWAEAAGLPSLARMGLDPADHATIAIAALSSSSMKGNPVVLSESALHEVLEGA